MAEEVLTKEVAAKEVAAEEVAADGIVTNGVAEANKVKTIEIEVEIDLDGLLIGDLELLDKAKDGDLPAKEMIGFLDRIVKGGVRHLPMRYLAVIIDHLGDAISESVNPGN